MPNGTFPGAATRWLVTEVWHPAEGGAADAEPETRDAALAAADGPYPLIVYSHGFMSTRFGGAYLARRLASHRAHRPTAHLPSAGLPEAERRLS